MDRKRQLVASRYVLNDNVLLLDARGQEGLADAGYEGGDDGGIPPRVDDGNAEVGALNFCKWGLWGDFNLWKRGGNEGECGGWVGRLDLPSWGWASPGPLMEAIEGIYLNKLFAILRLMKIDWRLIDRRN